MKGLIARKQVAGVVVDLLAGGRLDALDLAFRAMATELLERRRSTGGTFQITLEWIPEQKPEEEA